MTKPFGLQFAQLLVVVTLAVLIFYVFVPSALGLGTPPFGGRILTSLFCSCSDNFLLTVSGPRGGQFLYMLGAPQFAYYSLPRAGVWVLGLYQPGGVCLIPSGNGCVTFGTPLGTITPIVGTSR